MLSRALAYFALATTLFLATLAGAAQLDRFSMEQLRQVRAQARQVEREVRGGSEVAETPLWGRAILPPHIGRGWGELSLWCAYTVCLVAGVGWGIARLVTGPLESLAASTEALANGERAPLPDIQAGGALGRLSRRFRELAADIESRDRELALRHEAISRAAVAKERLVHRSYDSWRGQVQSMLAAAHELGEPGRVMLRNLELVDRLVDDLVDLAALERGLRPEQVSLDEVIEQALAPIRPQVAAKGLELRTCFAELPHLSADATRVRQVITNLLTNALKYTQHGFIEVSTATGEGWVEMRVRDSGSGIAQGALPAAVEEFRQLAGGSGVGLGLWICQKIVQLHQGTLTLSSGRDQGTEALVRLPL